MAPLILVPPFPSRRKEVPNTALQLAPHRSFRNHPSTASKGLQSHIRFRQELLLPHQDHTQKSGKALAGPIFRCESASTKIMMFDRTTFTSLIHLARQFSGK